MLTTAALLFGCPASEPPPERVSTAAGPIGSAVARPATSVQARTTTSSASSAPLASPSSSTAADAAAPSAEFVLLAGGDVNLGRSVGQRILRHGAPDTFAGLAPDLSRADVSFVNLESTLSEQHGETQSPHHKLVFTGPPAGAELLRNAGIRFVSVANNHQWDYGERGFLETLANLERVGVVAVGGVRDPSKLWEPARFSVHGLRVALFAVTGIWNQGPLARHVARDRIAAADDPHLLEAMRAVRPQVDVLLVSHHGGEEYVSTPATSVSTLVRTLLRAGADVVLGHHPHVLQGVLFEGGRPGLLSLGNLVFGARSDDPSTGISALARLRFRRGAPTAVELCPYYIFGDIPRRFVGPKSRAGAEAVRQRVRNTSLGFGKLRLGEIDGYGCFSVEPA